jgi:hypothetical protein
MPYQISWEDRGVSFQYTGLTSDGEVAAAVRHVEADERFDRVRYTIHDFLKCGGATYTIQKVEEIAALDAAAAMSNLGIRKLSIAVITDREDVATMARTYMVSRIHPHTMRIFSSLDEAHAWLRSEGLRQVGN